MTVLYLLSLDRTAALVFWAAAVQVGAFYVQRLHYETMTEWGTEVRSQLWLARAARALGLLAYVMAAYVWYRVGFVPAVVALFVMFSVPVAVSTLDVWLIRSPARAMAFVSAPLTVFAAVMMLHAAIALV